METIVRLWLLTPILLAVLSTSARGQASDEFLSSFSDNPRGAFQELEQKVVESGIASSRDELSEGLANYTNQYGATHWRTESIKLGIRQLDVLEKLSVDARGRLVDAGRDSAKALELFAQNRFPEALALAKQSLKATETVVGRSNILVAIRLELLGILEYQLLKLGDARAHLRDAVDCWRSAANERHPFLSQLQNNRGAVLTGLGLADEASEVFADARAIAGHTTGPASADYLHPSIALAESSASNGRYEEAYEITESIAGHIEQLEGPNELFLKLRTLQTVLSFARNRDEEKARPLSQRWPWKARKAFIRQTVLQYLNTLSEFGFILAIRKKSRLAGDVLAEFEEGYADIPGTPDANYCTVLGKIGIEYQLIGQPEKGYSHLKQAVAIAGSFLSGAEFSQMPERDQLNFKVSAAWLYNNYFQMALESGASAREISDNALQWKGSILRLQSMKQGIDGSQKQQSDAAATFASITREIEQILPPKSVLVNFVEYSNLELVANGSPKDNLMLAVVVNADPNRDPKYFRLGMSKPIRECVEIWNAGMANERATFDEQAAARDAASQLRKLVWAPLQETVDDAELVMISTDGYLGRFPFAALPGSEEGHFLIEEYRLVNIAVPGLFLNRPEKNQTPPQVNLLAFGGINYDEPVGTDEKENGRPADPVLELSVPGFPYLDHSLSEVESVAACFPDGDTKVLSGNQARESKFKELAPVSAHLLLSTHAVFQWRAAVTSDNNAQPTPAQQILNDLDIRSGIAFAAANNSLEGLSVSVPPRFRDDGILYAHEIEKLDLRSVELAVLSACDSGNGAPTSGEGIIGLTRAFQISGARNTLATLWQVDDRATKKIMVKFFEVLREEKISPDAALRKAQLWAINNPREVVDIDTPRIARGAKNIGGREGKRNLSPYYWAPFVMSGNVDGLQVSDK